MHFVVALCIYYAYNVCIYIIKYIICAQNKKRATFILFFYRLYIIICDSTSVFYHTIMYYYLSYEYEYMRLTAPAAKKYNTLLLRASYFTLFPATLTNIISSATYYYIYYN